MKKLNVMAWSIVAAGALGAVGCNNNKVDEPLVEDKPQISLRASNREIVAGDTTTLAIYSKNTAGANADIEWGSTGGRLMTDDNNRVARISFDQPGVYTVTARLLIDGREVDRESTNITVRPLK